MPFTSYYVPLHPYNSETDKESSIKYNLKKMAIITIQLSEINGVVITSLCIVIFFLIGYIVWKNDIKRMNKNK